MEGINSNELLNELLKSINKEKTRKVSILWDVENITPSANSMFVDGLLDYASSMGEIVISKGFGDWSNKAINKLQRPLSDAGFELIQVYIPKAKKSIADMEMITQAMEVAIKYPEINDFILITSDSDFQPLIKALKRTEKTVHLICDRNIVKDNLLSLAHHYSDYRDIMPGGSEDETTVVPVENAKQRYFEELRSAVAELNDMDTTNSLSAVKNRMKLNNPAFTEKNLGFTKWSSFVSDAVKNKFVDFGPKTKDGVPTLVISKGALASKDESQLRGVLEDLQKDGKKKPYFSQVSQKLLEKGFKYNDFGYSTFTDFMNNMERKRVIEIEREALNWKVTLVAQ